MAHDFILGSTGTNWSRGFSVLLPQTPDSSSMEEKTTDSDAAKAKIVAYIRERAKLHAGSELYRQAKQGDPGALDAIKIMVSKAKAGDPQAVRDVAIMKEAQKDFAESEKHQANIRLQDDLLRARSPMQGESLNDDELAVARDGGPSERAAFARVRGSSSIGRATPAQLAAQMASQQKAIAKRNLAIAQAAAAKAAAAAKVAQIRALYGQLWYQHANWLAQQDLNAKKKLQPRARYENLAKAWSKQIIAKGKLPTSSLGATSGADMSVAMFQNMIQAILASAQGQLLANPPVDPNLDPNSLTSYTPVYPYQTNPATALATSITTALAQMVRPQTDRLPSPDGSDTDSSGSLNDDELAVARDGGHSEHAALARMRGGSSIGRAFYPDISTFPTVRTHFGYKRMIPTGARYSVMYQGVRKNWLFVGPNKRPLLIP